MPRLTHRYCKTPIHKHPEPSAPSCQALRLSFLRYCGHDHKSLVDNNHPNANGFRPTKPVQSCERQVKRCHRGAWHQGCSQCMHATVPNALDKITVRTAKSFTGQAAIRVMAMPAIAIICRDYRGPLWLIGSSRSNRNIHL